MIIFLVIIEPYVVFSHLNYLVKTVQMRGHNLCFYAELTKMLSLIITKYSLLSGALFGAKSLWSVSVLILP